jgi:hypothetical protein
VNNVAINGTNGRLLSPLTRSNRCGWQCYFYIGHFSRCPGYYTVTNPTILVGTATTSHNSGPTHIHYLNTDAAVGAVATLQYLVLLLCRRCFWCKIVPASCRLSKFMGKRSLQVPDMPPGISSLCLLWYLPWLLGINSVCS